MLSSTPEAYSKNLNGYQKAVIRKQLRWLWLTLQRGLPCVMVARKRLLNLL